MLIVDFKTSNLFINVSAPFVKVISTFISKKVNQAQIDLLIMSFSKKV